MSDTAPAPAAPAATSPAPAPSNGTSGAQTPATPAAPKDGAGPTRGADGKFASTKPAEPVAPAERKKWKLKVHGEEVDAEEEQVLSWAEMGAAGKRLFTDVDKSRRQVEEERKALEALKASAKAKPWEALQGYGLTDEEIDKLSEARVLAKFSSPTDPKQAEAIAAERKARLEVEAKLREKEEAEEKTRREAEDAQVASVFAEHVPAALEAIGMPKSVTAWKFMRPYLDDVADAGLRLDAHHIKAAALAAKAELQELQQGFTRGLKGKALVDWLGKEVADAVRAYDIEEWEKRKGIAAKPAQPVAPAAPSEKHFTTPEELAALFRKK